MKKLIKIFIRKSNSLLYYILSYSGIRQLTIYRKIMTRNFTSGKLALGEKNFYNVPSSWITSDLSGADFNLDFCNFSTLPFRDNSIHLIYSCHMVEHLPEDKLSYLLRECFRVLKKNGCLRIEAPDCEKIAYEYRNNEAFFDEYREHSKHLVQNFGLPTEYTSTHITFIGLFSCYIQKNNHIPVYAPKEEIDKKLENLNLDDFGRWATSLQTKEQYLSGGHVNALYPDKLIHLCSKIGFHSREADFGKTFHQDKNILSLERKVPSRQKCSFVIECFKE